MRGTIDSVLDDSSRIVAERDILELSQRPKKAGFISIKIKFNLLLGIGG